MSLPQPVIKSGNETEELPLPRPFRIDASTHYDNGADPFEPRRGDVPVESTNPPKRIADIAPGARFEELVDDYKLELVNQALRQSGGNHRRAAALLGIHRSSFTRMLHRLERSHVARANSDPAED